MIFLKRLFGLGLVVFFYLNMNLHIYTFVDVFFLNYLMKGKIGIVPSAVSH